MTLAFRLLASFALATSAMATSAQSYPNNVIKIVVPFPAGGDLEPVARGLCEHFQKVWGQACVVEHKAGAQAMIGTNFVARSAADGHTLLLCSVGPLTINPTLYSKTISYAVGKDIVPVSRIATTPMVLIVGGTVPVKTYQDFVAYGKANPGKLSFASAGTGNVTHMAAELYFQQTGIKAVHVPYKGAQGVISDLLGGHVDLYFNPLPSALGYVNGHGDRAKPLAVTSLERAPQLPNVPTLDELGVKGLAINSWYGLCAPGGTPKRILDVLSAEVATAVNGAGLAEQLKQRGMNPAPTRSPEEFAQEVQRETAQWAQIISEKGIKIDH